MLKVSSSNITKRCLLISKITLKRSEWHHLTTGNLSEVTVRNHVLESLFRIYTNLQSSPTACNFNNSRPIYVTLWEMRNHYRNNWFVKNSKCQYFLFLKKQPQKWTNFQLFTLNSKGRYFSITKLDILIFCYILHLEIDFEICAEKG